MKRIVAAFCLLAAPSSAAAQRVELQVRAGVERVDYRYRFDNDSSLDTTFLVPHFFEQRYERNGPIFEAAARYRLQGRRASTTLLFSLEREASGSDFDTFFQPSGDIVRTGTAGTVDLGSLGLDQTVELGQFRGARFDLFFNWRRDRADFHPADRVVTHTKPPSETRELTTDRERTVSQTFAIGAAGVIQAEDIGGWEIEAEGRLAPAMRARLLIQLPDKYPGRDIVFQAAGWSGSGKVTLTRRGDRGAFGVWVSIEQAGSYRRRAEFDRTTAAAGATIAFGGRR